MGEELDLIDNQTSIINDIVDFSIRIEKNPLMKALSHIQSIVEKRNIIPILSNVKLEAVDGILSLTATDMDITVTEKISVEIEAAGFLTVPAHTLYDIVKKLPDDTKITLSLDKEIPGRLNINAGQCKFSLPFLSAKDFPVMDHGDMNNQFIMHPEEFIYLIDKTKFAISVEETRYNLNGIYLHIFQHENGDSYLRSAATDGHRLCKVEVTLPEGAQNMPGIIIPKKAIYEIRKLLESAKDEVKIALSNNKININFGEINLTSKLIDANFPEYENLIPYNNNKIMEVNAKSFSKAVDRVSTISFEKLRAVKLIISQNKLTILSSGEAQGSASEEIEVNYNGEPIEIGFNSKYLLDIMNVVQGDMVEFKLNDNYSPVLIVDKSDSNGKFVIMPMVV
ncbi:MAG: DNA polymerase III subunit beta [Alphaproteobacteria bacterium]